MNKQYIFNSSMPRSGSELLQVILHQNPEIYGSPTSPLLEYLFGARANRGTVEAQAQPKDLMTGAFLGFCRGGMDEYYGAITNRPVVCDKSRGWIQYHQWLESIMGEKPRMLCMVRDLRGVYSSMEKIFRKTKDMPLGPDDPTRMLGLTTEARVLHWSKTQPVGLALQRIYGALQQGLLKDIHVIRFEDLTSNPSETMKRVYKYLGMEPFDHDFDNVVKEVEENDQAYGAYGDHKVQKKIKPLPMDFEQVLGRDLCIGIVNSNNWFYDTFYR